MWAAPLYVGLLTATTPSVVAVFDIEARGVRIGDAQRTRLSRYVATLVAATKRHRIVPTDDVRRTLMREKGASYRDCYDERCQIEIGKELAASHTLSTEIVRLGRRCAITMRLYELRTAASAAAATAKGGCDRDSIVGLLESAVAQLTNTGPIVVARTMTLPTAKPKRKPKPKPKPLPKLEPTLDPYVRKLAPLTDQDRLMRRMFAVKPTTDPKTNFAIALLSARDDADQPGAIASFERLLRTAPTYPRRTEALYELGHLYWASGRVSDALAKWSMVATADANYWVGRAHDSLGQPSAAARAYARVRTGRHVDRSTYRRAWALYRSGRPKDALQVLDRLNDAAEPVRSAARRDRPRILEVLR